MKYHIIEAGSLILLVERVNAMLRDGWRPIGGPIVLADDQYAQALVKEPTLLLYDMAAVHNAG